MESEQRRKRKRAAPVLGRQLLQLSSSRSLFLYSSFIIFLLFLSSHHRSFLFFFSPSAALLRPPLTLSLLYPSKSNSILEPSSAAAAASSFLLQHRILFPDHLLLLLLTTNHHPVIKPHELECVYYNTNRSGSTEPASGSVIEVQPVISTDRYDESRSIARCPLPRTNGTTVDLRRRDGVGQRSWGGGGLLNQSAQSWDRVVYEATLDGNTVVAFAKGMNLRPHKVSDPKHFRCHFGLKGLNKKDGGSFWITTKAVSVAQELVRCLLPQGVRNKPDKLKGIGVTVSHLSGNFRHPVRALLPSVARIGGGGGGKRRKSKGKHELCVCTMVWNQASALREWVMYHAWLGVERWFIYDNNSDDGIEEVVQDLDLQGYNVSRQAWPWIKTQEAGFSHCALRARDDCNWVAFFDVDEFFYFPNHQQLLAQGIPLRSLLANFSSSPAVAEIRTACHSFGPSGLRSQPKHGVTVGYTCRLQSPERHKSIVRPDSLDVSLLNVVHHFQLREGFGYHNMPEGSAVINHYKYQVWDAFKAKFFRRVATYVADWQEDQNKGSKDRAPGLGTQAIEPPNWRLQFCEVWDTGLKDLLLSYFADPATGLMPWEQRSSLPSW